MSDVQPDATNPTRASRRADRPGAGAPVAVEFSSPLLTTAATLAIAGLLALTGYTGSALVAVTVLVGGVVLAWGWAGALALPSPRGTSLVLLLGTVALVLSAVFTHTDPYLRWVPAALAGAVIASFVHQLLRRDGRPRLVESVASTSMALVLVASGVCLIPLPRLVDGGTVLAAGLAGVALSAIVDLAARRPALRVWLLPVGMLLGGLAAILVGRTAGLAWGPMALLGVVGAAVSHALRQVLLALPTMATARPRLVSGVASVLVCGVCIAVVQRLFFAT